MSLSFVPTVYKLPRPIAEHRTSAGLRNDGQRRAQSFWELRRVKIEEEHMAEKKAALRGIVLSGDEGSRLKRFIQEYLETGKDVG